ncbi:MAG TPA: DUF929 family protein [Dictyobacter sp.]|jgi:hypothetical protein|nr:DUF929 family protein [Dictyobacter sp.]
MAKSKQRSGSGSAVQRREEMRQQRQNRPNSKSNSRSRSGRKGSRGNQSTSWILIGGIIVAVVVVVGAFIVIGNLQRAATKATPQNFADITHISASAQSTVGAGSVTTNVLGDGTSNNPGLLKAVSSTPILKGPTGKPEFFYMGAEYCPYCAAQRWSMIITLSRFGTFNKPLTSIISSEDNVPTYSFYQSSYSSQYIDFVPMEVEDQNSNPLQTLTPDQQALTNKYDAAPYTTQAGSFPFLDFGNQYVSAGAYDDPTMFVGQSYDQIVKDIQDTNSNVSQSVLGSANYMTAAICKMTSNQPGSVCQSPAIQQIEQQLPAPTSATASTSETQAEVLLNTPALVETRKRA